MKYFLVFIAVFVPVLILLLRLDFYNRMFAAFPCLRRFPRLTKVGRLRVSAGLLAAIALLLPLKLLFARLGVEVDMMLVLMAASGLVLPFTLPLESEDGARRKSKGTKKPRKK